MLNDPNIQFIFLNVNQFNIRIQFTNYLCYILVIFGIIGNILGLSIFSSSRRSWRISSIYVYLASSNSIINFFCVIRYSLILHSKSEFILHELIGNIWLACKIYEISFCFRLISSWVTLFWMFERLTCLSNKLRTFFYKWNTSQWKFICPLLILILILICVVGPPVYMYQPQLFKNASMNLTTHLLHNCCGLSSDASIEWQKYFNEIHFGFNHYTIRCLFSELIPTGAIIFFNSLIIYHLFQTSRRFSQTNHLERSTNIKRTTSWMNGVLILHSSLFFVSLFSHILGHLMSIEAHETWWVILAILANSSLNFYVYCLSGQAFRQEILRFIRRIPYQHFNNIQIRQQQSQQTPILFKRRKRFYR